MRRDDYGKRRGNSVGGGGGGRGEKGEKGQCNIDWLHASAEGLTYYSTW